MYSTKIYQSFKRISCTICPNKVILCVKTFVYGIDSFIDAFILPNKTELLTSVGFKQHQNCLTPTQKFVMIYIVRLMGELGRLMGEFVYVHKNVFYSIFSNRNFSETLLTIAETLFEVLRMMPGSRK